MSSCQGLVPQGARPGSARVLVTELGVLDHINPTPTSIPLEDSGSVAELTHLTPEKLVGCQ